MSTLNFPELIKSLRLNINAQGAAIKSVSPIDGSLLGTVAVTDDTGYEQTLRSAMDSYTRWREVPAPRRGEMVREIGAAIRAKKHELGALITWEVGKILPEGESEVQEAIDIADYAAGISRQLYGKVMQSERPRHRMYEQWHPLGVVGVITAFNFPMAVWAWNSMIAAVCGDAVIWKPSELAPLSAGAINGIAAEIAAKWGFPGLFGLIIGDGPALGARLAADKRIPLISATGSCRMGRAVGEVVARRLGRSLLELGGNNAVIVLADADLELAVRSTVFGAAGTAGQRCTTTRRLIVERPAAAKITEMMARAYRSMKIGNPLEKGVLIGPLINEAAVKGFNDAVRRARAEGGEVVCGGETAAGLPSGLYVQPTIIKATPKMEVVAEETFAPILYVIEVDSLEQALQVHNSVPQGLSSSIFTRSVQAAEIFLSAVGSDCGIANVNTGTSQAEIGGAFGGEKDTGGGRESGSDSWQQYMRRQTNTINWSDQLPLAQGLKFE